MCVFDCDVESPGRICPVWTQWPPARGEILSALIGAKDIWSDVPV